MSFCLKWRSKYVRFIFKFLLFWPWAVGYDQKNKITDTSLRCELFGSFTVKTCCFSCRKESVEVVWVSEYNAYMELHDVPPQEHVVVDGEIKIGSSLLRLWLGSR